MPYIKSHRRAMLDGAINELVRQLDKLEEPSAGDLNYIITRLCLATGPQNYLAYNHLMGVLECVKQELYRRRIAPYEDIKATENGDVY